MIIYPIFVLFFGFVGWCFYMAWYQTPRFQKMVDNFDVIMSPGNFWGHLLMGWLLLSSTAGFIYSWYQR